MHFSSLSLSLAQTFSPERANTRPLALSAGAGELSNRSTLPEQIGPPPPPRPPALGRPTAGGGRQTRGRLTGARVQQAQAGGERARKPPRAALHLPAPLVINLALIRPIVGLAAALSSLEWPAGRPRINQAAHTFSCASQAATEFLHADWLAQAELSWRRCATCCSIKFRANSSSSCELGSKLTMALVAPPPPIGDLRAAERMERMGTGTNGAIEMDCRRSSFLAASSQLDASKVKAEFSARKIIQLAQD